MAELSPLSTWAAYNEPRVFVRRARTAPGKWYQPGRPRYWNVYDCRGPKVFIRQFTFSYFEAALKNADLLARGRNIDPTALCGVQRIEYGSFQDPFSGRSW